jgi:WD40 repeat protein
MSILEGHSNSVRSIAWSQDGSRLASASSDIAVRIWDPATGQCALTLHINSVGFLQFDKISLSHLHTSVGTFNLSFTSPSTYVPYCSTSLPKRYGYGLNDDGSWITYNGDNLLWLPAEYRPIYPFLFASSATKLAIACSSDRVIFLMFSEHSPIPGF